MLKNEFDANRAMQDMPKFDNNVHAFLQSQDKQVDVDATPKHSSVPFIVAVAVVAAAATFLIWG